MAALLALSACSRAQEEAQAKYLSAAVGFGLSEGEAVEAGQMYCSGDTYSLANLLVESVSKDDQAELILLIARMAEPAYCPEGAV